MNHVIRKAAAPALLTLGLFASCAWAQDTTAATSAGAAPAAAAPAAAAHGGKRDREDVVEKRISDLHAQLKITDQQAAQWDAFAQTMRDNAQKTDQAFQERAQKMSSLNADDSMKSYAALAQLHADNMQKLVTAFTALYGVLSEQQKATADTLFRNEGGHHHHGMHKPKAAAPAAGAAAPAPSN